MTLRVSHGRYPIHIDFLFMLSKNIVAFENNKFHY